MKGTLLTGAAGLVMLAAACFSAHSATGPATGSCTIVLDPPQYGATIVAIQNFAFDPTPVHIKAGAKVSWLNCEPAGTPSHTTTADGGAWDSGLLAPGKTFTVTLATVGTYAYHCSTHPFMTAQVVVDP
jgi:plastocyanin